MKISTVQYLIRYITTYHFLSCFMVYLVIEVDGGSIKSELRTKQLLLNIRTHLAQQVDEVVKEKECDSGLTLCEPTKSKQESEEIEGSEEIPPPPKIRGHHKPIIKVNPKDVIQTMIHKAHKPLTKKTEKPESESEKESKAKKDKKEVSSDKDDEEEDENEDDKPIVKIKRKSKHRAKKVYVKEGIEFPEDIPVFAPTTNIVKTALCRKHSRVYLRQLKRYKTWALMMYDASAKIPSGILKGNVNQYGDFDECLAINAVFKNPKKHSDMHSGIQGKYCLASIDVSASGDDSGLQQAVYRSQSYAFIRSRADDPGHFIPRFSTINWGLCVPSACQPKDVEKTIELGLSNYNESSGLLFQVKVDKENCVTKEDTKFNFSFMTFLTVLFYASAIGTTGYATYKDLYEGRPVENREEDSTKPMLDDAEKSNESNETRDVVDPEENKKENADDALDTEKEIAQEDGETKTCEEDSGKVIKGKESSKQETIRRIIMAFSLKKTVNNLLSDHESEDGIMCIHGIKAIFTIMLYFAHKTIPLALTPFNNRILLTQISNESTSVLLRASIIYTDSFLLISGVLTAYNLYQQISTKGKIFWVRRLLGRFIRLTPALLAVLLFYAYIFDHLGSGPTWNIVAKKNAQLCQESMWKNLLYIQNFFAFEKMCAPQTHQLALDMQLSVFAPVGVYLLYRYDKIGLGALQALFLLSSIMRYLSTSNNNLSLIIYHGMPVSQLYKTANDLYSQPMHRATPYILGLTIGYYLKKYEGNIDFPKPFVAIGWIAAFCFGFLSVVTPSHLADRSYQYDVDEASQYSALCPIAWALALGWLIVACHFGYGGQINDYLSHKALLVVSKISYSIYLTQFLVFFYWVGIKRIPETFSISGSFNITELAVVIIISIIVTLLFDLPMKEVKAILLQGKEENSAEETIEETEQAEAEAEYEGSEILSPEENAEEMAKDVMLEELDFQLDEEELELEDIEDIQDFEEEEEEEEEEEYDERPLRRTSRIKFDEDSDDREFWENENKELEAQKNKAGEQSEDFWGENED